MHTAFYNDLQVIDNFSQVSDARYYRSAPEDWWVLITDVQGSTKAIEEGRYKDVNQLGVATIAFVKNLLQNENFLFVFGGDGATLVLSDDQFSKVQPQLWLLEKLADNRFKLDLRVGAVQVQDVLQDNHRLEIALLKINDKQNMAVFFGGGLTKAEEIIKGKNYPKIEKAATNDPPLEGLSCRWQPLPAKKGEIASILIASRNSINSTQTYTEVISGLNKIFNGNIDTANPVNIHQTKYKGLLKLITDESRLHHSIFTRAYWKRSLEIFICVLCFKCGVPLFDKDNYITAIPTHSDYKKFDDTLRMVLDGTIEQIQEMQNFLDNLHQQEKIFYGVHISQQALMTCMVEGLSDGHSGPG